MVYVKRSRVGLHIVAICILLLVQSFSTVNQVEHRVLFQYSTTAHLSSVGTEDRSSINNNITKDEIAKKGDNEEPAYDQLTVEKEHWMPEEIFELPPVMWRQWLKKHQLTSISKLRNATLWAKGCGISMRVNFTSLSTPNNITSSSLPSHSAFFKASKTDLSQFSAESHLREIKAYYLDRILGTNVVLPCVGHSIQHKEIAHIDSSQTRQIAKNTECMVRNSPDATTTNTSFAGSAMIWLTGAEKVSLTEALAAPRRYQQLKSLDETTSILMRAANNLSDAKFAMPLYEESAVSYAAFHYLGGCMKSDHNHFAVNGTRFAAIDNDRCMTPKAISSAPSVPKKNARRISQWAKIVLKDICYFPQKLVANIERAYEARHDDSSSSDRISHRLKHALSEDLLALELLESQPEAFFEIDERVNKLVEHIRRCRRDK